MKTPNQKSLRYIALASLMLCALGAQAQDKPVELKFAHWLPAMHPLAKLGFEPWAKSVEAASKGSIKVMLFPAQQLGKAADHYDMARDGIAEMTWVNPGYQAGRFPIVAAGELPFLIAKPGPGPYQGQEYVADMKLLADALFAHPQVAAFCPVRVQHIARLAAAGAAARSPAAMSACRSAACKPLYEAYRARGLAGTESIVILARKLLRIAYAVWKSGQAFDPSKLSPKTA